MFVASSARTVIYYASSPQDELN